MKITSLTIATLALLMPALASAQSADLSMSGSIVPGACTPMLTNGGMVELGRHSAATLNPTSQTMLPDSDEVTLVVTCTAPAFAMIHVIDNARLTVVPGLGFPDAPTAWSQFMFGIGAVDGVNIGMYGLVPSAVTVDGVPVVRIYRQVEINFPWFWKLSTGASGRRYLASYATGTGVQTSWGVDAATGPMSGLVHSLSMFVVPVIRKGEDLPLAADIPLAGSVTFSVSYL